MEEIYERMKEIEANNEEFNKGIKFVRDRTLKWNLWYQCPDFVGENDMLYSQMYVVHAE